MFRSLVIMNRSRKNQSIRREASEGDVIVKKLTLPSQSISTTAGAIIAVTTTVTSGLVQSNPATEWASFAARYQQYRVRKVRVRMMPVFPGSGNVAAGSTCAGQLYVSDYIGSSAPTSAAQVLSDEGSRVFSTSKVVNYVTTWARNPNAKLWNPTSAVVPTANEYGVAWASSTVATAMAASQLYFSYDVEWTVEFRGSQ